jgi:hypothetical protein
MINVDDVMALTCVICGIDSDVAENYKSLVENATSAIFASLRSEEYEQDPRIINLCATKAGLAIAFALEAQDNVTSFTAGDITINQEGKASTDIAMLFQQAKEDCAQLLNDDSFAFLGV